MLSMIIIDNREAILWVSQTEKNIFGTWGETAFAVSVSEKGLLFRAYITNLCHSLSAQQIIKDSALVAAVARSACAPISTPIALAYPRTAL